MPSVIGLLEQRELGARRRVDELREEADRIQAELAVAEREWKEWAIARSRVGEVLAPVEEAGQDHVGASRNVPAAERQPGKTPQVPQAAKPRSQVPVWREGLDFMDVVPARVEALRSKAKRLVARGWLAEPAPGRFMPARGVSGPGGGS
jgi:hypothetical protein